MGYYFSHPILLANLTLSELKFGHFPINGSYIWIQMFDLRVISKT